MVESISKGGAMENSKQNKDFFCLVVTILTKDTSTQVKTNTKEKY